MSRGLQRDRPQPDPRPQQNSQYGWCTTLRLPAKRVNLTRWPPDEQARPTVDGTVGLAADEVQQMVEHHDLGGPELRQGGHQGRG